MKTFIALLAMVTGLYGQTNWRTVMVDTNGVVQRPTNFVATNRIVAVNSNGVVISPTNFATANAFSKNLFGSFATITNGGTNLSNNVAATLVLTNVGTQPRAGLVTVFFENLSGLYSETAHFVLATSGADAHLGLLGRSASPTNQTTMEFSANRSNTTVTMSFTNVNTNAVRYWIFFEGRDNP